tara:strand:- start:270 stop:461 length:192 start_codon:yes stop_codon:yes gene_type:complete
MDQDYIFTIIGKLYFDIINAQRGIEDLQSKLKEKDRIIQELESSRILGNNEQSEPISSDLQNM